MLKILKLSICACTFASLSSIAHANEAGNASAMQPTTTVQSSVTYTTSKNTVVNTMPVVAHANAQIQRKRIRVVREPIPTSTVQKASVGNSRAVVFNHKTKSRTRVVGTKRTVHAPMPNFYTD